MAHTKADVMQARADFEAAGRRLVDIHRGVIQAIENSLRAEAMISAEPVPLHEADIPAAKKRTIEAWKEFMA